MNVKIFAAILVATSLVTQLPLCQADMPAIFIQDPYILTFAGAENLARIGITTVFAVQTKKTETNGDISYESIGSGFFLTEPRPNNRNLFGVTCNHVVKDARDNLIYLGIQSNNGYLRYPCNVLCQDDTNDIAILCIANHDGTNPISPLVLTNLQNTAWIGSPDANTNLVPGRGVLIIGYPLHLGIHGNKNNPVVRFGMIAQQPEETTFLIDGTASHGNSGSLVLELNLTGATMLGMVDAFEPDLIPLSFDTNGLVTQALQYNSGLTIAIKSSVILKDAQAAFAKINQ